MSSEPGRGARFQVRLMLSSVAVPRASAEPRRIAGYAGPRRTILVVDDDADHRALMREVLEPLGFTVLAAADGPSALTLAGTVPPDLFLLDISMPGMNGWALAEALRAGHPDAPIVMLSANIGDGQSQTPEGAAHDATLAKPFDLRQLLDRLQALLRLVWIDEVSGAPSAAPAPMVSPGTDAVEELLRLGRIGYVRGIEAKLAEIDADPSHGPFVAAVREPLRRFDFRAYTAFLEAIGDDD